MISTELNPQRGSDYHLLTKASFPDLLYEEIVKTIAAWSDKIIMTKARIITSELMFLVPVQTELARSMARRL